jgi:hypothetical protein
MRKNTANRISQKIFLRNLVRAALARAARALSSDHRALAREDSRHNLVAYQRRTLELIREPCVAESAAQLDLRS